MNTTQTIDKDQYKKYIEHYEKYREDYSEIFDEIKNGNAKQVYAHYLKYSIYGECIENYAEIFKEVKNVSIFEQAYTRYLNYTNYIKCIEDYVEIFDELKNDDICKQSFIHYVNLIKINIDNDILKKYFNVDCDGELILHNKPKYNDKVDYYEIFSKLKKYKENYYNVDQNFLYMYLFIFLILNKDDSIHEMMKLIDLNYKIDHDDYDIILNKKSLFIIKNKEIKFNIPNEYLTIPTNFNKHVKFSYEMGLYETGLITGDEQVKFSISITFDEIPTFADIIKYNNLIILHTMEKMYRNFLKCIVSEELYDMGDIDSVDIIDMYETYKHDNCDNDNILINQVIPQFMMTLFKINLRHSINLLGNAHKYFNMNILNYDIGDNHHICGECPPLAPLISIIDYTKNEINSLYKSSFN